VGEIDTFYRKDWEAIAYKAAEELPDKDKKLLLSLFKKKSEQGNSGRDLEKTGRDVITFKRKFLPDKPLSEATFEELAAIFGKIFKSSASYYTIKDYRKHLIQFYREKDGENFNPIKYEFMRCKNDKLMKAKKSKMINKKQVLNQDEVKVLVDACKDWRDKAFIMISFDVMARVGALSRLKVKDIFTKGKDIWLTFEKTKEEQDFKVGLTFSQPYLRKWIALHPDYKPEQYLFCAAIREKTDGKKGKERKKTKYGQWEYSAIQQMFIRLMKETKISKHVNAHIFRGSGSTFWKAIGGNDQTIENRGGWARGSKALRETYFVFEEEESHESAKALLTGQKPAQEIPKFVPLTCVMCNWQNEAGAEYCFNCHHRLALKDVAKEENLISQLQQEVKDNRKQTEELMRIIRVQRKINKSKKN